MNIHPIAQCYPSLSDEDFSKLKEDIRANGQRVPIVIFEDHILDGVHRQRVCEELGIEPLYDRRPISDPFACSKSLNETRRHLTLADRAMIGEKMANLKNGSNRYEKTTKVGTYEKVATPQTISNASKTMGVSRGLVERTRYVRKHGAMKVVSAMEEGRITISRAYKFAHLQKEEQEDALANGLNGKRKVGRPKGSIKKKGKPKKIIIDPAPLDTRCDRLWHQMCSGWLDTFSTVDEKRAVFRYMIEAMTRAMQLINEVDTMEDLYARTH